MSLLDNYYLVGCKALNVSNDTTKCYDFLCHWIIDNYDIARRITILVEGRGEGIVANQALRLEIYNTVAEFPVPHLKGTVAEAKFRKD